MTHFCIDISMVFHKTLYNFLQSPLTGHMQRGSKFIIRVIPRSLEGCGTCGTHGGRDGGSPWTGGTVDISSIADEEASCDGVVEENGLMEKVDGEALW